jgi:hypothetical protein
MAGKGYRKGYPSETRSFKTRQEAENGVEALKSCRCRSFKEERYPED